MSLFGALGGLLTGQANEHNATPQIDMGQVNKYGAQGQADYGSQQGVLAETNALAQGKGPSAANAMLNQQTANTIANANSMAASGSGNESAGLNRRQAMMQGSQATQQLGGQAAAARAQEQLGAIGQAGELAGQMRGQDLQGAGMYGQLATNQAGLQQQTNQLNTSAQVANMQANAQTENSVAGMAAGALGAAAMADGPVEAVDLQEPGGQDARDGGPPRGWVMRELGDSILLVNKRTGQMAKMAMQPLSPDEMKEAQGPHGAGPLPGQPGAVDHRVVHKSLYANDLGVGSTGGLQQEGAPSNAGGLLPFAQQQKSSGGGGGMSSLGSAMAAADLPLADVANADLPGDDSQPNQGFPDATVQPMSDEDFSSMLQQSVNDGANTQDSGGNAYGVPGYSPPAEASSNSFDDSSLDYGVEAPQDYLPINGYPGKRFGKYSAPAQGVGGGDANDPDAARGGGGPDGPGAKPDSGSKGMRVLAAALGGYANPKGAMQQLQQNQQAKRQPQTQGGPVQTPSVRPPQAGGGQVLRGGDVDFGGYVRKAANAATIFNPSMWPAAMLLKNDEDAGSDKHLGEVLRGSSHDEASVSGRGRKDSGGNTRMDAGDLDLSNPQSAVPTDHPLAALDAARGAVGQAGISSKPEEHAQVGESNDVAPGVPAPAELVSKPPVRSPREKARTEAALNPDWQKSGLPSSLDVDNKPFPRDPQSSNHEWGGIVNHFETGTKQGAEPAARDIDYSKDDTGDRAKGGSPKSALFGKFGGTFDNMSGSEVGTANNPFEVEFTEGDTITGDKWPPSYSGESFEGDMTRAGNERARRTYAPGAKPAAKPVVEEDEAKTKSASPLRKAFSKPRGKKKSPAAREDTNA